MNLRNWTVLADCNWSDKKKSNIITVKNLNLNSQFQKTVYSEKFVPKSGSNIQILHIFEFWSSSYTYRLIDVNTNNCDENYNEENGLKILNLHDDLDLPPVVSHCAKIYAFRLFNPLTAIQNLCPEYIGSNLHFTCGNEIKSFDCIVKISGINDDGNRKCNIIFEDFAVRSKEWSGYIWVFLPFCTGNGISITGSMAGSGLPELINEIKLSQNNSAFYGSVWKVSVTSPRHNNSLHVDDNDALYINW